MSHSFPQVPGGGLVAHEQAGGHTLAKHVGKTEAELQARLAQEPRRNFVSSFSDETTAESVITEAISANQTAINAWLTSTSAQILVITYTANNPPGFYLVRGSTNAIPSAHILVVLKANISLPLGYYILTAYIEP